MLIHKILRGILRVNISQQSKRNFLSLAQVCRTVSHYSENGGRQFASSQSAVSYERNRSDRNKISQKISKTLISFKYLRLIKKVIRESGPIPKDNPRLTYLIENAQKNHVSPDFINFAINLSNDTRANFGLYGFYLPNGCHLLIQYEDVDPTITRHHLLKLCERYDGNLTHGGTCWPKSFEQKGMIFVRCSNSGPFEGLSEEHLISKVGIQSCHKEKDAEGVEYWKLYCDPWQLHNVKKQCEDITSNIEEVYVGYVPKKIIIPSRHTVSSVYNVLCKLGEIPTIDNLYSNLNLAQILN